ncbi:hypothetical protein L211DRAFT_350422 [Terfezia boudieri ATCC MYA-4762]|uniref:Uncharacterized protein n=1 Tax=Terfezia boudieri ATCC MYA-4762 TaxID=1051890 RepID=A0A3N4LL80_9PEZI|nr:hypothetical protein L211DRAFT_350422 [Terfezia boudieri ATCC MYA-4762]
MHFLFLLSLRIHMIGCNDWWGLNLFLFLFLFFFRIGDYLVLVLGTTYILLCFFFFLRLSVGEILPLNKHKKVSGFIYTLRSGLVGSKHRKKKKKKKRRGIENKFSSIQGLPNRNGIFT